MYGNKETALNWPRKYEGITECRKLPIDQVHISVAESTIVKTRALASRILLFAIELVPSTIVASL